MNFYETKMGQHFFNAQLPKLIRSLEQIADALACPSHPSYTVLIEQNPNFLRDLYYRNYEPSVFREDGRHTELNYAVSAAEATLKKELRTNSAALTAFDAYQHAQTERNGAAVEQAFESGYQTATQMIVAGLNSYPVQKGGKNVE